MRVISPPLLQKKVNNYLFICVVVGWIIGYMLLGNIYCYTIKNLCLSTHKF